MAVRVGRSEAAALLVAGRPSDEPLGAGVGERADGVVEPERGEGARLPLPRAEARAPQQPLGLRGPEPARGRRGTLTAAAPVPCRDVVDARPLARPDVRVPDVHAPSASSPGHGSDSLDRGSREADYPARA